MNATVPGEVVFVETYLFELIIKTVHRKKAERMVYHHVLTPAGVEFIFVCLELSF